MTDDFTGKCAMIYAPHGSSTPLHYTIYLNREKELYAVIRVLYAINGPKKCMILEDLIPEKSYRGRQVFDILADQRNLFNVDDTPKSILKLILREIRIEQVIAAFKVDKELRGKHHALIVVNRPEVPDKFKSKMACTMFYDGDEDVNAHTGEKVLVRLDKGEQASAKEKVKTKGSTKASSGEDSVVVVRSSSSKKKINKRKDDSDSSDESEDYSPPAKKRSIKK